FSSRRRHTRFSRDWSSDVCSSDLLRRYHMFTTSVANTPAQFAGVAALNGDQQCVKDMVDIYRERRDKIVDLIDQTPYLTGYKPGGAFYAFPNLPPHVDGSDVALRMLKETGVCAVPGDAFGESCTNALRFSFSTPDRKSVV